MAKLPTFLTAAASLLLLAPLSSSQAQSSRNNSRLGAFSGGGAGRDAAIASASGARGGARGFSGGRYYGGRGGYRGYRTSRYYYRGGYYAYDPFFFGGFGYPSYYYGADYGYGFGYPLAYNGGGYPGPYGDRVYNGRILDESDRGGDRNDRSSYSPGSLAGAVQRELKGRGYYKGRIDGQFGEGSSRALKAFQRDKGLSASGRINERTLEALGFEQR